MPVGRAGARRGIPSSGAGRNGSWLGRSEPLGNDAATLVRGDCASRDTDKYCGSSSASFHTARAKEHGRAAGFRVDRVAERAERGHHVRIGAAPATNMRDLHGGVPNLWEDVGKTCFTSRAP